MNYKLTLHALACTVIPVLLFVAMPSPLMPGVLAYTLFCFFTARLLAEYLPGIELWLATLFVCLCPAILHYANSADSIISALAAFAGFICFLKLSDFFKHRRESVIAALLLGFAACLRPIESLGTAGLLLVRYMIRAKSLNRAIRIEGALYLACVLVGILIVSLDYPLTGNMISEVRGHQSDSTLHFFALLADFFSWPLLVAALAIALLRLRAVTRYWRMALMFVPAVFIPALVGIFIGNGEYYYYLPATTLAYQVGAILALQREGEHRRLRVMLMAIVVSASLLLQIEILRHGPENSRLRALIRGPSLVLQSTAR